ncbi:hypothetical protein INR49_032234 [Caranx melampygus]|nr:hypothetical protein INR49_032234 [Caranx melampygus]
MEQYTTATTTTGEQIVVQTANGQIQQQTQGTVTAVQLQTEAPVVTASASRCKHSSLLYFTVGPGTASDGPGERRAAHHIIGATHHGAGMSGGQGQTIMQVPVSGAQGLQQVRNKAWSLCSLWNSTDPAGAARSDTTAGGSDAPAPGPQGQPQQIIIQQPQTAITAGQNQGQQISVQGQQVAQTADGQTIVYQPVNADGTVLQQGMITIPAASLAGAQIVQAGGANTNTTNSGQGTVTVTLPVSGNMVNAGGMVMALSTVCMFVSLPLSDGAGGGGVPTMQRIPLPGAEMLEEEPLYVNAKQYHRILKRRQAGPSWRLRAIPKEEANMKYLHESRHRHAMQRKRGDGDGSSPLGQRGNGFGLGTAAQDAAQAAADETVAQMIRVS